MHKFIRRTLFFLSVFVGLNICLFLILSFIERKYSNFRLKNNPKYIVVGHSHSECAYNDSLIPGLKNISHSGESYFYTYFKIKQVIRQNPSVKTVFIEIANNQITQRMNDWIWGNRYMSNNYPIYFSFMSTSDNMVFIKNNLPGYFNVLSFAMKNSLLRICRDKLDFTKQIGGYLPLNRDIKDTTNNSAIPNPGPTNIISETNLTYLDAIIEYCKKNGVKPILIRSPLHEKYRGYDNETLYKQIIEERYANIEYLDFSKYPLPDADFGDLQHLNYKGSSVFSKWFADQLQAGLLDRMNKQAYIEEAIRLKHSKEVLSGEIR